MSEEKKKTDDEDQVDRMTKAFESTRTDKKEIPDYMKGIDFSKLESGFSQNFRKMEMTFRYDPAKIDDKTKRFGLYYGMGLEKTEEKLETRFLNSYSEHKRSSGSLLNKGPTRTPLDEVLRVDGDFPIWGMYYAEHDKSSVLVVVTNTRLFVVSDIYSVASGLILKRRSWTNNPPVPYYVLECQIRNIMKYNRIYDIYHRLRNDFGSMFLVTFWEDFWFKGERNDEDRNFNSK